MNLIEQLGGYENVSKHFNRIEYHAETKIFIGEWFGFYSMRDLKDALLEYRRANGIYEVEDKVVILTLALGNTYSWKVESFDGCMIELSQVGQPNEWAHITEITHATDEEIKAGHRL